MPPNAHDLEPDELKHAFEISPAVIVTTTGDGEMLWILTPSTTSTGYRVSMFLADGPAGHEEGNYTLDELMEYMTTFHPVSVEPVGDAEVIAWTTTPEFIDGSRRVHVTQMWNELGGLASSERDADRKQAIYDARELADRMCERDLVACEREMVRAVRRFAPVGNPARYVPNPTPWVTKVLGASYEQLEALVPAAWLPKITKTDGKRKVFTGILEEYGCGAYGCVLPTLDPSIVLKVTTDESEADFAKRLAQHLPSPICTTYFRVAAVEGMRRGPRDGVVVGTKRRGDPVFLLWREEAKSVGKIDTVVGRDAEDAIAVQHDAAKAAFVAMLEHRPAKEVGKLMTAWRSACGDMARVDELAFVADGLLAAERAGIFISDVHGGNLGVAMRYGAPTWIITDPGNVVVTDPALAAPDGAGR